MRRLAIGLVAGALVLTACQAASETLTEQALEQIDGVDGVDIDVDSGEVSLETDEGKVTVGGGEIPDNFGIPLPDGYEVMSVFTSGEAANVTLSYAGADYDTIVAFFEDWTSSESEEWSKSTSTFGDDEGQTIMTTTFSSGSSFISVNNNCITLAEDSDAFDAVCVTAATG